MPREMRLGARRRRAAARPGGGLSWHCRRLLRAQDRRRRRQMPLMIDEPELEAASRLVGIRLALLTTRMMEQWSRGKHEPETVLILLSVVAITGEKFTRSGLTGEQRALRTFLPLGDLQGCNVSSIAAATG